MTITIVGLGPGDIDDLSRKAWRVLKQAPTVYLRTSRHGCVSCLPQNDITYHSFDDLYDTAENFEAVYNTIVERLLEAAQSGDVVYAVPGDPLVGESTTTRILAKASAAGIRVEIVSGIARGITRTPEAARVDARDKEITRFGEYAGGLVLAGSMVVPLGLAVADVDQFWIANAIYAALVLSTCVSSVLKLVASRASGLARA